MTVLLEQSALFVVFSEFWLGNALARIEVRITNIPGVTNVFLDEILVNLGEVEVFIDNTTGQITISHLEGWALEYTPSNIATAAFTKLKSWQVVRSNCLGVRNHSCSYPITKFVTK